MGTPRIFQLALVDLVTPPPDWFGPAAKNTVKATLQQHMAAVKAKMSKDDI